MEYIDFHTHTFPDKIAEKAVGKLSVISGITPATNGTLEQTKDLMSKVGISRFVIFNIATNPGKENTINNTAAKVCEDNKGKIISLGSVHPRSQDAFDHLENVKKLGLQGIKLHPDYQEFHVDDEFMYPFYKACEELELFVAFHAGYDFYSPDHIHARPEALSKIAKDFPNLKMHFAHMGSLRRWNEVSECIAGLENVYMDTSMCLTDGLDRDLAVKIINRHPAENVLFGSDCPWENPAETIKYVDSLKISDDRKEMIFCKNALSLLKW